MPKPLRKAVVAEAMAMLEARDMAQAQQAAALLQLQARHRAELQSMQLEIHLAEQPTYLPDMVVASTATDLVSMVDASTCTIWCLVWACWRLVCKQMPSLLFVSKRKRSM